ncbi:hypothetical protein [Aquabacterium sp.]|uniref:hypothetical protein n=1 Tax=Aquabacterium sp. TaxID=1872578 RepID=UPI0025B8977A|nr:hypothetical protein [Aquabacterium sp.]
MLTCWRKGSSVLAGQLKDIGQAQHRIQGASHQSLASVAQARQGPGHASRGILQNHHEHGQPTG